MFDVFNDDFFSHFSQVVQVLFLFWFNENYPEILLTVTGDRHKVHSIKYIFWTLSHWKANEFKEKVQKTTIKFICVHLLSSINPELKPIRMVWWLGLVFFFHLGKYTTLIIVTLVNRNAIRRKTERSEMNEWMDGWEEKRGQRERESSREKESRNKE